MGFESYTCNLWLAVNSKLQRLNVSLMFPAAFLCEKIIETYLSEKSETDLLRIEGVRKTALTVTLFSNFKLILVLNVFHSS